MRTTTRLYLAVMAGGALGAAARYLGSLAALALAGPAFPWGTLAANGLGSLLIGFYAAATGPDGRVLVRPAARQFVMIGLLGGFTTFSIFSLETVWLIHAGRPTLAALNVLIALVVWVPAAWLGHGLAVRLNRLPTLHDRSEP
jgi:fluoride exporter